ncbi:MAG: hypothetical protein IIX15_00135 [Clostridia bacterium]|nr:hypothetical protein [Clostridia bacterium]
MRIQTNDGSKLEFFQELYEKARQGLSEEIGSLEKWWAQYEGDLSTDGGADASIGYNMTRELIEAQVDTSIPMPRVEPKRWSVERERRAKAIERLCIQVRDEEPYENMNDLAERYATIFGGVPYFIDFDATEVTHNEVGRVRLQALNPRKVTPQPGVYEIEAMEYVFVQYDVTVDDVVRRYGVSYEQLVGAELEDNDSTDAEEVVTVYICYYRNDCDAVCKFAWSGDAVLCDEDDYYRRKVWRCKCCGRRREACEADPCSAPDYERQNDEYEELDRDIKLEDGRVIPALSPVFRDGEPVMEDVEVVVSDEQGNVLMQTDQNGLMLPMTRTVKQVKMEPTRLPYYTPKCFPVVIRKNTSKDECLFGMSDCECIRPLQIEINKLESRIHEKIMRTGAVAGMPDDAEMSVSNSIFKEVYKIPRGADPNAFRTIEYKADISQEIMQSNRIYEMAKRMLGITNSYLGQPDTTAKSGYAKQLQISQSAGRLESKKVNKNAAQAKIDRIIFEFNLAYTDEPRPVAYKDAFGNVQNATFNRYAHYEYDEMTGQWYIDDDYLFSVDQNSAMEKDRRSMWELNMGNLKSGMFGDVQNPETLLRYWQMQERAHYPHAREMVEYMQQEVSKYKQSAAQQGMQQQSVPQGQPMGFERREGI